ncbi:hypothetical protein PHYPSEUDO_000662 [Phytophthora pseudosyringae]|uniref:Crinkler (CRN) family protein n=1 Tax=Phytophthora pseudosyringae TaxID=221518 RepID=A0A8T1W1J1_9STRA|nr:hypothetical protein PHYPSEUDO_000662 [Phytophthora pseudosyringae]
MSTTTASDRTQNPMPVCSGISGLGKTRMLEEGITILQEVMKLDRNHIASVIVPYSNGFRPHPVEQSMSIEASISWRLLFRVFLDKNCSHSFQSWFQSRLPCNGGQLTLENAVGVVVRKLRKKAQEPAPLYLFLGIDDYQKITKVGARPKETKTPLVRELVEAIGALVCSKLPNLVLLPMFAGTDLGVIASGSLADSSYYVMEQLPMTLLTLDQMFSLVESNAAFAGLLQYSRIRRNLFTLGGVPGWVVKYLLELKRYAESDVVSLDSIDKCFVTVWTTYVDSYLSSLQTQKLVRLAAFAVSGRQVGTNGSFDETLKWSRLRDSSLCLLILRASLLCDVRVPYALLYKCWMAL